ncbi:hypothetical protein I3760_09G188800 [Carya illinoinensis]|nr:hypothetical protein I3760_09G188800 [Carya illinoinensis]
MFVGDFNIIQNDSERRGGRPRTIMAMEEFNNWIHQGGLMETVTKGSVFSWCNGQTGLARSWACLDRALMDSSFLALFPNACCSYLPRSTSDHAPMFIELMQDPFSYGPAPFRFQQMWVDHHDFLDCVRSAWEVYMDGSAIYNLSRKLKMTKVALREWNKRVFGHTLSHIDALEKQVEEIEQQLQLFWEDNLGKELQEAVSDLTNWRRREEMKLAQMTKLKWKLEGDRNTKFHHACLANKRRNKVLHMRSNGVVFKTPEGIHQGAVEYFTSVLHGELPAEQPSLEDYIAPVISEEENTSLILQEFFVSKNLPKYFTASYLVLKSKVESTTGFLPRLISLEQGAFIPGRSIFENISLTQEMVHSINRRIHGGNIMLKVDMAKAYDRVDWAFLIKLLHRFGFSAQFCDLVHFCISSPWYSIMMNGTVHLEDMMNKVRQKISGWKMRLLSSSGKLILLRHVISSMAIHLFAVLQVPQVIISKIHKLMSSFFWGESDGRDKRKWVAWRHICNPVEEGGLGLQAL